MKQVLTTTLAIFVLIAPLSSLAGDCGDVDNSGAINILDVTFLINYLYKGGPAPDPIESADVNADDIINILDITYLINYLYLGGPAPDCECGVVIDIDGNVYQTVKIGDQCWMAENLKVTRYRNGDPIYHILDPGQWEILTIGAYCEFDNNPVNVAEYGRLYNWYAVDDSRGLAPAGWHMPTDAEWQALVDYLGGDGSAGGKMKETGTAHWNTPNIGATNESGFTALPGGYRGTGGFYYNMGFHAYFWSSTEETGSHAWLRLLSYLYAAAVRGDDYKQFGYSIRCVRD